MTISTLLLHLHCTWYVCNYINHCFSFSCHLSIMIKKLNYGGVYLLIRFQFQFPLSSPEILLLLAMTSSVYYFFCLASANLKCWISVFIWIVGCELYFLDSLIWISTAIQDLDFLFYIHPQRVFDFINCYQQIYCQIEFKSGDNIGVSKVVSITVAYITKNDGISSFVGG